MKRFLALSLCIFCLITLYSCKNKNDNSLKIMHCGEKYEISLVDTVIADLKNTYGIDAVQDRAPAGNAYMEKLMIHTAGGIPPDVLMLDSDTFMDYARNDALVDLTPLIASDESINLKKYYREITDRFSINNSLYVLPRSFSTTCAVFYNKKAFDEAGLSYPKDSWNTDDFLAAAQKLVKKDKLGRYSRYGFADDGTMWEAWVYSFGGAQVDNIKSPSKCLLNSKEAVEGLQFRADLINKYKVMPFPSQIVIPRAYDVSEIFASGRTAMFYGTLDKAAIFSSIPDFEWDVVMFPRGPKGHRAFPAYGSGFAIMKSSKKQKEAWKAVKMLSGEVMQNELSKKSLLQPAIIKIALSDSFLTAAPPQNKKIALDAQKYAVFPPSHVNWEEIRFSYLLPALDRVWNGSQTAEEAMKKTVPQIDGLLSEGR